MESKVSARQPFDPRLAELIAAERNAPKIVVADTLKDPHPFVATTAAAVKLASQKPKLDSYGHLEYWEHRKGHGCVIQTSVAGADRALRVFDALFKAYEARGCSIVVGKERWYDRQILGVKVEGALMCFSIRERVKQRPFNPKKDAGDSEFLRRFPPKHAFDPTGELFLKYEQNDAQYGYGKGSIQDRQKQRLEDSLNDLIVAVYLMLDNEREHQHKSKQAELERRREAERQQEIERKRKEEQDRVNTLLRKVDNWHQSYRIRDFVAAVRAHHAEAGSVIADDSELGRYLLWAESVANRLDPLHPRSS